MARGMVVGEKIVSQAGTEEFRREHDRIFGDKPVERGRWVWDSASKSLVRAEDYRAPPRAVDAPIIADRIHEGTSLDVGDRVVDLGSRAKRRAFMRETGLAEASDYSTGYRESRKQGMERDVNRKTDAAFDAAARRLYHQGKLRD